jgi:hypothetical protein
LCRIMRGGFLTGAGLSIIGSAVVTDRASGARVGDCFCMRGKSGRVRDIFGLTWSKVFP